MVPEGWTSTRLGNEFTNRRQKGKAGQPTLSVTLNDGLVERSSLDRRTDTNLAAEEHLSVMPGDIAYNMMRMWQGASGISKKEGLVSPAYVVLSPNKTAHPDFMAYLFKSPKMIHSFWAYSYGLTDDRLRLYFKDFSLIPVVLPPLDEQMRIADILQTWDRAIITTQALLQNSKAQTTALMQRLLSGQNRLPGFSQNWRPHRLRDLGRFIKGKGISRDQVSPTGLPCVRYGEIYTQHDYVIRQFFSYIDVAQVSESQRLASGDLLFTCSGETAEEIGKCVAFVGTDEAYAGGDIIILRDHSQDAVFLSYLLNSNPVVKQKARFGQGNSVVHINAGNLGDLAFTLPPIEEQQAIAAALEISEAAERASQNKLAALQAEKAALMQQLLTGLRRVKVSTEKAA